MDQASISRLEEWDSRPVSGGYVGLNELATEGFTGVVTTGGTRLVMLNGRVAGVYDGTIEDFADGGATAHLAPDPSLPLLFAMRQREGEVRGRYYTDDTPLREVDQTLTSGGFTGYVELAENVLSGDYYVVYYGGRSLAVAFVGNNRRVVTGEEAFDLAADEVGIYEVTAVDVDVTEVPEPPEDSVAAGSDGDAGATDPDGIASDSGVDDGGIEDLSAELGVGEAGTEDSSVEAGIDEPADEGGPIAEEPVEEARPGGAEAVPPETDEAESGIDEPADGVADLIESAEPAGGGTDDATQTDPAETDDPTAIDPDEPAGSGGEAGVAPEEDGPAADAEPEPATEPADPDQPPSATEPGEEPATEPAGDDEANPAAPTEAAEPTEPTEPPAEGSAPPEGEPAETGSSAQPTPEEEPDERFEEEARWREARTVPALDPDESEPAGGERPVAPAGEADDPSQRGDLQERLRRLESDLESSERERRRLTARLEAALDGSAGDAGGSQALHDRIEALETQLEAAKSGGGGGSSTGAASGPGDIDPGTALDQTDLFVRYRSKGGATLETAHAGRADRSEVAENLRIETHSRFDADEVTVAGQPFTGFLAGTINYRFVTWLIEDLLYEIQETGTKSGLKGLYDVIPDIDRAEFNGTVTGRDEEGEDREIGFDVVCRDRMGKPLVVANINDSLDPATGGMTGTLVADGTAAAEASESIAAAFFVTASFFEPDALETVADATRGGGLLSRDSKKSFVKLSRSGGYHLCLVEARGEDFHTVVPDL